MYVRTLDLILSSDEIRLKILLTLLSKEDDPEVALKKFHKLLRLADKKREIM